MAPKLNQIIAVEKGAKSTTENEITKAYHLDPCPWCHLPVGEHNGAGMQGCLLRYLGQPDSPDSTTRGQ